MALTDKESILALKSRVTPHEVALAGGESVFVRCLTGNELDSLQQWQEANQSDLTGYRARIAASGLCDGEGVAINFTEKEAHELGELPASLLTVITNKISELSGLGEVGNDDGPPADDSGSD